MAELLLDGFTDLADARPLLFGNRQKLLPGLFAVCARLMPKGISNMSVHRINQCLGDFPGFIEQREISWVSDICRSASGVNQQ